MDMLIYSKRIKFYQNQEQESAKFVNSEKSRVFCFTAITLLPEFELLHFLTNHSSC